MGKQQDWSVTNCVFLFLFVASQFQFTSQTHFQNHLQDGLKRGIGLSSDTRHLNAPSLPTTISGVNQQKEKDLIKNLPGQPSVSFKQYGGYVAINETTGRFFYYYFVEAIKANDSSPLVLWLNGGPGCSSVGVGALVENGPFRVHSDGKTLFLNPYSWNQEASILYLESPAQVGFSYTKTPSDLDYPGDTMTAEDNYTFLLKWLERFPEYKGRDFYITGESYAGHYCPKLAQLVVQRNDQNFINLRGVLLGNPELDEIAELQGGIRFLVDHGIITQKHFDDNYNMCLSPQPGINADCGSSVTKIHHLYENLDIYNINSPLCRNSTLTNLPKKDTNIMHFDPCSHEYVAAYLNTENVQEAMHAKTTKLPYPWKQCNRQDILLKWNVDDKEASMVPILQELMSKGIRLWVYSGDMDTVVPFTSTMDILKNMNLTVGNTWRQWFSGGELGGFTEDYKVNFRYATVRGAGHGVPTDQPTRALTLFTSFIHNTPLPHTL